jgi:ATP-dependent Clp protease adapter protein ClpS
MSQTVHFRREEAPAVRFDIEGLTRADSRDEERLEPPCRVIVHNDDVTPIEYVASLLRRVFGLGWFKALRVTMKAHVSGRSVVVVEGCRKARQHVDSAHEAARSEGHNHLRFSVEPTET